MAKSGDSSDRKSSRKKSRGEKLRETVFGALPRVTLAKIGRDALPTKPDTGPLYDMVQELAAFYEAISHPSEMMDNTIFMAGVRYLDHPGFTNRDLMMFAQGDNEILAQVALCALSRRPADPDLRKELLTFLNRVGLYRRFFILEALMTHVPDTDPLIGEVCWKNSCHHPHLQLFLTFWRPFLDHRFEGGEQPTFAGQLADQGPNAVNQLEDFIKAADDSRLDPLIREIYQWRETFIDKDVLRAAGRLWGESGHSSDGPVIDHPELVVHVDAVLKALEQKPKRSSLLIGEHGCGKTAVMRAVGRRLAKLGWLVFEANGSDLVAGQKYIGEFEARMKALIDQLSGQRRALWFAPDFASLKLAGTHQGSRSGALDMLMPLVDSGQIVMVGEILPNAFEKLILEQPRCLTSFNLVRVPELDEAATLDLARQWIAANSPESGPPVVSEPVLKEAWLLGGQYLHEQAAPGNLLGFLEQALGLWSAAENKNPAITIGDLVNTLSRQTGLPAAILDDRESLDTGAIRAFFQERILGQPEAVGCLLERINIIKSGLADPSRPQGVFLFAGPTGTGKTEIAKALASYLFGSENRLIRMDMSEFQNPQSLDRLTGGETGTDAGSLASLVRKQPFSVVLLDEFEKAHPRVWDLFLQVFDDGRLTDTLGRTTDFRHAIILLTSNLGAHAPQGASVGFDKDHEGFRSADVDKAIAKVFRREFLNRLDRVVVFRPLSRETMRQILVKELSDVQKRRGLRNRNWEVVWEESATDFLLDRGFSVDLGARPLKRAVERYLLTPLADTIVSRRFPEGDQFLYIHSGGDRLQVEFIDPNEPEATTPPTDEDAAEVAAGFPGFGGNLTLAGLALGAKGSPEEQAYLRQVLNERQEMLTAPPWTEAKDLALSMMSVADFWSSAERFTILGEVEYRDRVENGLKTAATLLDRTGPAANRGREHYSRRLLGQVAERLLLIDLACEALARREPWEAFLILDIRTDAAAASAADRKWLTRLRDMYLAWAASRNMRAKVLLDLGAGAAGLRPVILAVSGFAAFTILRQEEGLHIWEEPSTRHDRQTDHRQVLVRVAVQPEEISGEPGANLLPAALEVLAEPLAGAPAIVRHYRELPAPLVKDRTAGWRTGNLDRVLGGDFDLLRFNAAGGAPEMERGQA